MLSWKSKGTPPIAKVGKKLLYINHTKDDSSDSEDEHEIVKSLVEGSGISLKEKKKTKQGVLTEREYWAPKGQKLTPCLNIDKTQRIFVVGPTECGKSTLTSFYLKQFRKVFPKRRVLVYSQLDRDPAYDKYKIERADIEDIPETTVDDLQDSLVIFDDLDTVPDPNLMAHISRLRNSCIQIGRHKGVYSIFCGHTIFDGRATGKMLRECSYVALFPQAGNKRHIHVYLADHAGLDKEQEKKVLALKSRWILVSSFAPIHIIHEDGMMIV